eukprot:TRINITY_DN2812_c0_g1_i1.p1 TRINITY_DN2812_c0_g1~~TRINITY_DN2812_c0_g1_i1.p1  ORF type:complete len:366 (-),score=77.75 TRINITY_DN2812_c0_g1_i1:48-1145(-)
MESVVDKSLSDMGELRVTAHKVGVWCRQNYFQKSREEGISDAKEQVEEVTKVLVDHLEAVSRQIQTYVESSESELKTLSTKVATADTSLKSLRETSAIVGEKALCAPLPSYRRLRKSRLEDHECSWFVSSVRSAENVRTGLDWSSLDGIGVSLERKVETKSSRTAASGKRSVNAPSAPPSLARPSTSTRTTSAKTAGAPPPVAPGVSAPLPSESLSTPSRPAAPPPPPQRPPVATPEPEKKEDVKNVPERPRRPPAPLPPVQSSIPRPPPPSSAPSSHPRPPPPPVASAQRMSFSCSNLQPRRELWILFFLHIPKLTMVPFTTSYPLKNPHLAPPHLVRDLLRLHRLLVHLPLLHQVIHQTSCKL